MLAKEWTERNPRYDFAVVGSGYGGAITAARLSEATPTPSICVLERGREYPVGTFPDTAAEVVTAVRNPLTNPLGLYEFLVFPDISVLQGSGLGGTSLINANVAIQPDAEVFEQPSWPSTLRADVLHPYYERARRMLAVRPHPRSNPQQPDVLLKVRALDRRATELQRRAFGLDLAVNFDIDGLNPHGVEQHPCFDCGDCVTGCNSGAKNTLYMNYLPMAAQNGAHLFTGVEVRWLERLPAGGWRIHGRRYLGFLGTFEPFTLEADHVVLSAGALGTTEILLRSEQRGLSLSPRVGTGFTGNGDFFAVSYNADPRINTLGFGNRPDHPWRRDGHAPGPSIVGAVRYDGDLPLDRRIVVEDFSIPSAYVRGAMLAFGAAAELGGTEDTDVGDEHEELARRQRDNPAAPYDPDNAINHSLVYLVMGHDDAKGTLHLEQRFPDFEGRLRIHWDDVGRQPLFERINEELRRHARALGARFLPNPAWNFVSVRNLVTAHPLGGCPVGEDHVHGAVDEYGRVFASDGSIHQGLFVADGSIIPSALGVNPFLTISALSERIAERMVRYLAGEAYDTRPASVAVHRLDPAEVAHASEADLERLFTRTETGPIDVMINSGARAIDVDRRRIRNDAAWKGFFPRGHVLNQLSSTFFAGFQKRFWREGTRIIGETSDSDGRIRAANTLEEVTIERGTGTLEPGRYILLRYPEPQWAGFYDIFKVVDDDVLIGRVYLGTFPNGVRLFTFPMVRSYALDDMNVADHRALYERATVPTKQQLDGVWEMRLVSNAANTGTVAYLQFSLKPDGRLESRYLLLGLLEGSTEPVFGQDHFQMNDFTPFHDEIRRVADDYMIGRYTTPVPPRLLDVLGPQSLGLIQIEDGPSGRQFSFLYTLVRSALTEMPATAFMEPLLNVRLPAGLGLTLEEEMRGSYFPGFAPPEGPEGDHQLAEHARGAAQGVPCRFNVRITVRDANVFFEDPEHEGAISGTIQFDEFDGRSSPPPFEIDSSKSRWNYLRANPATGEAEMCYRLQFRGPEGHAYLLDGRKYLQKDRRGGVTGPREVLEDFTTLYARITQVDERRAVGSAVLKFRTFEDPEAAASLWSFLTSLQVTGTDDPALTAQARARLIALTNQFVLREYDPANVRAGFAAEEIREAVLRGADTPDYFSTRPTPELQAVMRETPTRPLEQLLNRGEVRVDYENRRIWRDAFWKGSFAKDTLLGWEERLRNSGLPSAARDAAARYTGGSFWKRFDTVANGEATGYVVNYELQGLPGDPVVRQVRYPDSNRRYVKAGDEVLLLTYRNEPYRIVYDLIKVIDENDCIGVMHLGEFPNGLEFATFVMARHNYPFEHMSVPDHHLLFDGPRNRVPTAGDLQGRWQGRLVFLTRPDVSLLNQLNPVVCEMQLTPGDARSELRYRFGFTGADGEPQRTDEYVAGLVDSGLELRLIDDRTLLGRQRCGASTPWMDNDTLMAALRGFLEPGREAPTLYYVLSRV